MKRVPSAVYKVTRAKEYDPNGVAISAIRGENLRKLVLGQYLTSNILTKYEA